MKQFYLKILATLLYLVIPPSIFAQYNDGDTFTKNTVEGVEMVFKVISNTEKTCQVGTGTTNAINLGTTSAISIPRMVNGYTVSIIGSKAFQNCTISKVTLTDAITSIQSDAFRNCVNLGRIDLPPSVRTIGSSAFKDCSQLDDVRSFIDLPFDIEENVFQNISNWASLTVLYGTKEKYISAKGWNIFSSIWSDVAFIDGIRYSVNGAIPEDKGDPYTAWVNSSPKWTIYTGGVKIPSTLTIGDEAFVVKGIDDGAFKGSQITSVIIPNTIKHIDDGAFMDCHQLQRVQSCIKQPYAIKESVFRNLPSNTILYVPIGCKALYEAAEGWNVFSNIVEIETPEEDSLLDGDTFTAETVEGNVLQYQVISAANKTCKVGANIFKRIKGHVTIPEAVKGFAVIEIVDFAFENCDAMTGVTIPVTVTAIGSKAFAGCTSLTGVHSEIKEPFAIDNDVFPYDQATLYIPVGTKKKYRNTDGWKNFKTIDSGVIEEDDVFTAETVEGIVMTFKVTSMENKTCQVGAGDGTYAIGTSHRGKVTIPSIAKGFNVTYICKGAFLGCELDSINIPNVVNSIGDEAFEGCMNMKSLVIPNGLASIGKRAFFGCSDLASVTIPNSVKSIGQYAFGNCIGLNSVTSLITVPYKLDVTVFQCTGDYDADIMYGIAKLFVPIGRSAVYASTTGWSKFKIIADADTKFKLTYMVDGEFYKSYDIQAAEVITPEPAPYKEHYFFSGWSDIPYLMPAHDVMVYGSFRIDPEYEADIDDPVESENVPKVYYSLEGRRLDTPQHGMNIIRMSDGAMRKVVVKQ